MTQECSKGFKTAISFSNIKFDCSDSRLFATNFDLDTSKCIYPLVIRAVRFSNQKPDIPNNDGDMQSAYFYYGLARKSDGSISASLLFHKIDIKSESWIVKCMYGTEDSTIARHDKDDCAICYGEKADIVCLPCRHLAIGLECAKKIKANKDDKNARDCPVCRVSIVYA